MGTLLGTILRGLRSRLLLSAGSVLLTALAVGSAVLGPAFQTAVTGSFLVTRLDDAPNNLTGLSWSFAPAPRTDPQTAIAQAEGLAADASSDAGDLLVAPQSFLRSAPMPGFGGEARLGYRADACEHLVVEGSCPTGPDEALMLVRDADLTKTRPGDVVTIGGYGQMTITGTYATPGPDDVDWWFEVGRLGSQNPTPPPDNYPYRPAPLLTTIDAFGKVATGVGYEVLVDRRLTVPPDLDLDDLDRVVQVAQAQKDLSEPAEGGTFAERSFNDLAGVEAEVRDQQATARASVSPAVLSLVLVALALLLRLLTAAADLRLPELALASLRGLPRRRMWSLGLSEPTTLLLLALPVGALLGVGSTLLLIKAWLVPGLPLLVPWASWAAGAAVGLGAAAVAVAAVGLVLRVTLSDQLTGVRRPQRSRRVAVVAQLGLVAAAGAVLVSKLSTTDRGRPDLTDLVLPVLLAVVAGLAAARGTALLATWWTRSMPRSGSIGSWVAVRALSRRQEGTLVILPLTAAVAICVFGAGVYDSAAAWRASVAATRAPGAVVWSSPQTLARTLGITHQIDPDGRWLMAAGTLATPSPGPIFSILDTSRLDRVGIWSDQWTPGTSAAEVADELRPQAEVPVVTGRRIGLSVDNEAASEKELTVRLRLAPDQGRPRTVYLGPFPRGEVYTHTASMRFCRDGCRLDGITLGGPAALPTTIEGRVSLLEVTVDGEPQGGAFDGAGWVVSPSASSPEVVDRVAVTDGGLSIDVVATSPAIVQLSAGDLPEALPVLRGVDANTEQAPDAFTASSPLTFDVAPVRDAASVPLLGPRGLLIDYETISTNREIYDQDTDVYVLSRADTPPEVQQALRDAGISEDTTYAEVVHDLGNTAYALALRLYAIVAALVLVMALAALAVSTAVQLPSRRRDAASLRVVGVPRRQVMGSVLRELALVLGGTAVAGLAAGTLAQYVVLRTVTLGYAETLSTPALVAAIDPVRLALLAAVTAVLLGSVALVSAVLTVRGARGATLRENAR